MNPCQNGGICFQNGPTTAVCLCTPSFTGYLCEFYNPCLANPCANGATCRPVYTYFSREASFRCFCPTGYTGTNCEINLNTQCTPTTCNGNGQCFINPTNGQTSCLCQALYTGIRCQEIVNPCWQSNGNPVCQNFATCSLNLAQAPYYSCLCRPGYFGQNCQLQSSTTTSTTLSTRTSSEGGGTTSVTCVDTDRQQCIYYANNNSCSNLYILNGKTVPSYCPLSCGLCSSSSTTTPGGCVDTQSSCSVWATLNLCPRLLSIVPHPCPRSCNVCS